MQFAAATHVGRRQTNQDRYLIRRMADGATLVAVADGMGGHAGGEEAATRVIDALQAIEPNGSHFPSDLVAAILDAGEAIRRMSEDIPELEGMGTTLTAAVLDGPTLSWTHVGDSRLYVLHGDALEQVTVDQTLVQGLVEAGVITPEAARTHPMRHMIDQCVGCPECEPERGCRSIAPGDLLMLCTDGLHDILRVRDILAVLHGRNGTPLTLEDMARALVRAALDRGASDNVTVVLARAMQKS
jgi:PPM family protein phosphatase